MLMTIMLAAIAAQALASPPAPAPTVEPSPAAPSDEQRIAQSSSVGQILYAFDRAAWVSTDALRATAPKQQLTGSGGYIVEPIDAQTLHVTYYHGDTAHAQAFFVADVRNGKVEQKTLLDQPVALTPRQLTLAKARDIAAQRAKERAYKPCTPSPFNTVVLPSRSGGPIAVYLLSAQQDAGTYPLGGNFRVIIGPDGQVLASRPYSVGCINMTAPKLPAGAKPVGFVVNDLLDPVPTEIHVFASYSMHMPIFVTTPDHRLWKVQGAAITPADRK
ncbi:hypothetical protein [Sphingomonas sp. BAUL-RG-20F-R05-02]|uniref:hypothetical protein n=1 Tax=Sphingomonas sp. BAUL-RG-20F-R05-02 TaxID=2914830 RepID=UPI001F58F960|nr:hypothetical protein [Sphingomonas sp. BAUL-RG-20F-R05-02]